MPGQFVKRHRVRAGRLAPLLAALVVVVSACSAADSSGTQDDSSEVGLGTTDSTGSAGSATDTEGEGVDYKPIGAEENNAWVRKMVDCLKEAGFSAEAFESTQGMLGFQNTGGTAEQVSAWSRGINRCQSDVGAAPEIPRFTPEEIGHLYDFYLRQKDCLTAQGYTISEPPSRETYVATYYSSDPWGPYADVDRISPTALSELEAKCPQQPTADDLR